MNFEALSFIKKCVRQRRIFWTEHVNIRLKERFISRENIINSTAEYEIIDENHDDYFLPTYLIYTQSRNEVFHLLVTVDFQNESITIVTSYKPSLSKWEKDFKTRKVNEFHLL